MRLSYNRRFWIHLVFWVFLFILLFVLNRSRFDDGDAFFFTFLNVAVISGFFYANYLWLSAFYAAKSYLLYFSLIGLSLCVGVFVLYEVQKAIPSYFEERMRNEQRLRQRPRSEQLPPTTLERNNRTERAPRTPRPGFRRFRPNTAAFRIVPGTIMLLMTWALSSFLRTADEARKKEREVALLRAEKFDTELKLLKSQINPHFLFNALNNIYSLTVTKSEMAPDMLLKLSSMLRYVLYEGSEDKVPLSSEVKYLKDYIDLQRLKDEDMLNIEFTHTQELHYWIHPMLLIPFVENAFKHSKVEDLVDGWISIDLRLEDPSKLSFSVENSVPKAVETDQTGGIGIENVRKRLDLLYPGKYLLDIEKKESSFHVLLELPLN